MLRGIQEVLRSYHKKVNCPLQTYTTDYFIAKTNVSVTRLIQPSSMLPALHAEALVPKPIGYCKVYDEYVVKGILNKGVYESACHSMRSHCCMHPE